MNSFSFPFALGGEQSFSTQGRAMASFHAVLAFSIPEKKPGRKFAHPNCHGRE